eukprot:tig00000857_g4926.t1
MEEEEILLEVAGRLWERGAQSADGAAALAPKLEEDSQPPIEEESEDPMPEGGHRARAGGGAAPAPAPVSGRERDGSIRLRHMSGRPGAPTCCAVSPDGSLLVIGGSDGGVRCMPLGPGFASGRGPHVVAVGRADGSVGVLACAEGRPLWRHRRPAHASRVTSVSVSADGRTAASGGADGWVRIWRTDSGEEWRCMRAWNSSAVAGVALSADGRWVASDAEGNRVRVWLCETGEVCTAFLVKASKAGRVTCLALAGGNEAGLVAAGAADGVVRLWRLPGGSFAGALQAGRGATSRVESLALSADGARVFAGLRSGQVRAWAAPAEEASPRPPRGWQPAPRPPAGHAQSVSAVACDAAGAFLATASALAATLCLGPFSFAGPAPAPAAPPPPPPSPPLRPRPAPAPPCPRPAKRPAPRPPPRGGSEPELRVEIVPVPMPALDPLEAARLEAWGAVEGLPLLAPLPSGFGEAAAAPAPALATHAGPRGPLLLPGTPPTSCLLSTVPAVPGPAPGPLPAHAGA